MTLGSEFSSCKVLLLPLTIIRNMPPQLAEPLHPRLLALVVDDYSPPFAGFASSAAAPASCAFCCCRS